MILLEEIIGSECYNANIQNWGPGGIFEGEGRSFRYPITFYTANGAKLKRHHVDDLITDEALLGGYYAFGANELHIMSALDRVLAYLEGETGVKI